MNTSSYHRITLFMRLMYFFICFLVTIIYNKTISFNLLFRVQMTNFEIIEFHIEMIHYLFVLIDFSWVFVEQVEYVKLFEIFFIIIFLHFCSIFCRYYCEKYLRSEIRLNNFLILYGQCSILFMILTTTLVLILFLHIQ